VNRHKENIMRFRFFPVALVVLGVTLLLGNLGIVPKDELRQFFHTWWPLLLVAAGSAMLLLPRGACSHRHCGPRREESPPKVGPA
jgi:hypothetical protein